MSVNQIKFRKLYQGYVGDGMSHEAAWEKARIESQEVKKEKPVAKKQKPIQNEEYWNNWWNASPERRRRYKLAKNFKG